MDQCSGAGAPERHGRVISSQSVRLPVYYFQRIAVGRSQFSSRIRSNGHPRCFVLPASRWRTAAASQAVGCGSAAEDRPVGVGASSSLPR